MIQPGVVVPMGATTQTTVVSAAICLGLNDALG
jgi:hypothetical protein